MNVRIPSLDAAAYYADRIAEAEAAARQQADNIAAGRAVVAAMKAVPMRERSKELAAHLISALSAWVEASPWGNETDAEFLMAMLDDASDWIRGQS